MSVPSACPHCQIPLPDGFIGRACPHCRGALGTRRKRSLSGFSFQAVPAGMSASSRPPDALRSSVPPREVVEDRWDLPDAGGEASVRHAEVPPAAPTGFPAVPSSIRSTMALGIQSPATSAVALPSPTPARSNGRDPIRATAQLDPFAWNLDHAPAPAAPPPRGGVLDVRALKQTALGVSPAQVPSPRALAGEEPPSTPASPVIRTTALGFAPPPAAAPVSLLFELSDDLPEADAFPLVRISQPSSAPLTTRPPPAASAEAEIDILSSPAPPFQLDAESARLEPGDASASQMPTYSPFRAPPSHRPGPVGPVGWGWTVGGAALVLSAVLALRSTPLAVALRGAAAVASLLMIARFGGLSMRALLLLLVALPALAQETLSITSLSRAGAGALAGALVLLPSGAWMGSERVGLRRVILVAGIALTTVSALMPGGVARPWALGAAPALALGLAALATPARWVPVTLTGAMMAWAAACGATGGLAMLPSAATGLAMAALVLVCGRALAAVIESDEG